MFMLLCFIHVNYCCFFFLSSPVLYMYFQPQQIRSVKPKMLSRNSQQDLIVRSLRILVRFHTLSGVVTANFKILNLKQFTTFSEGGQGLGVRGWRTWSKGVTNAMKGRSRQEKRLDSQGCRKCNKNEII